MCSSDLIDKRHRVGCFVWERAWRPLLRVGFETILPRISHCLRARIKADRSPPTFLAVAKEGSPTTPNINQHPGSGMKICQPFQNMRIHIVPSHSHLFHSETPPILIPIEIQRFILRRHLGARQKTALPTPKQFLPVSHTHH